MDFTFTQYTKILAGAGATKRIGELVAEAGYRKPFIVIDPGVEKSGAVDIDDIGLKQRNIEYIVFDRVIPDPPSDNIDVGAAACRENGCDCVIAIGGGSCIDTAKGINLLRFNPGSVLDYAKHPENMKQSPGLITVPTTSGTGSELSDGLIVTDTAHNAKVPILATKAMSEYAVIDPALTLGVPRKLTIATGLDVFSHAFECYTCARANIMCDAVTEKAMQMVIEYLPTAVNEPENLNSRTQMSVAATLAGWMLGNTSTYVGHSIAHVLGARMHMVHGEACAYGLPGIMEFISDVRPHKLKRVGLMLGADFGGNEPPEEIGRIVASAYRKFRDETVGLHLVSDYRIDKELLDECAEEISVEPFAGNTPKALTKRDIYNLLVDALIIQ